MTKLSHAVPVIILIRPAIAVGFLAICAEPTTSKSINLIATSSRTHFSRMSCSAGGLVCLRYVIAVSPDVRRKLTLWKRQLDERNSTHNDTHHLASGRDVSKVSNAPAGA